VGVPKEDTGGSSGGNKPYESFAGDDVNVNITDVGSFYTEMTRIQLDAMGPAHMEVGALSELIRKSFLDAGGDVGVFPEGAAVARMMQSRQSDFQHFMKDALEGVRNIGAASVVIAEMYHDTDFHSAAGVDAIAFAFSDPNAKPPAGFRKTETYSEYEQRMAEKAGQNAMALSGDDSLATSSYSPFGGMIVYNFSDGSSKQVVSIPYGNGHTKTETTIYGPGGKVLSREVQEVQGQTRTVTSTNYNAGDGTGTRSTTTTTNSGDGTMTVKNESTAVDKDGKATGKPQEHTTTINTDDHRTTGPMGPVEQAEKDLGTSGTDEIIRRSGVGY